MPKSKTNSKSRSKSLRRRRSQKTQKNKVHRGGVGGTENQDPASRPLPPNVRPHRRPAVGNYNQLAADLARRAAEEAEQRAARIASRTTPTAGSSFGNSLPHHPDP